MIKTENFTFLDTNFFFSLGYNTELDLSLRRFEIFFFHVVQESSPPLHFLFSIVQNHYE